MRYEGNKVVITESELRWLVNESAKNVLLTEVGNWAGIKNAWNGLANGKFNVKKSFQTAKQAQTFQKYYNNAQKAITGMQQVLNNSDQGDLANKLQQVNGQLQQAANGFQQRAAQASGRQQQSKQPATAPNMNAGGNTGGNTTQNTNTLGGANGSQQTARTVQMTPQYQNTASAAAQVDNTPGLATKMGQGLGKAVAGIRNFGKGVANGYNNNKVNFPQNTTPQAETPQAGNTETPVADPYTGKAQTTTPTAEQSGGTEKSTNSQQAKRNWTRGEREYAQKMGYKLPESKTVRITQDYIRDLVTETLNVLSEDGVGGGGATNAAGVMQGGGTNPGAGTYDVPAFGGKSKKKVGGNAFSEPILKQAHNLGDVTKAPANQVDMKPALKRGGSIAMGESIRRNKVIDEAVDEGIGNWLKGAALGGMMAMSPMQGNAQTQNYQHNDSTKTTVQQSQQMTIEQLMKLFPQAYKDRNANPQVWQQNQKSYVAEVNGKTSLVGKIAASHGQNPWDALVKRYCPQEDNVFQLGDFDI